MKPPDGRAVSNELKNANESQQTKHAKRTKIYTCSHIERQDSDEIHKTKEAQNEANWTFGDNETQDVLDGKKEQQSRPR